MFNIWSRSVIKDNKKATGFNNFKVFEREKYSDNLVANFCAALFISAVGGVIAGLAVATYYVWLPMLVGHRAVIYITQDAARNDRSFGMRFWIGATIGFIVSLVGVIFIYNKHKRQ